MNLKKINEYLIEKKNAPKRFEQDYFKLAICEIILGNYSTANDYFDEAITFMFGVNPYWRASGLPNWLVDIVVLSGRPNLYSSVLEELTIYRLSSTKINPVGTAPMAYYCYSVMKILCPSSGDFSEWINNLLKRPKKDFIAMGLTIQAILNQDQDSLTNSLQLLLKAHEGMAKHGELRLTPEGWLCLPAMTLSFLAIQKGLKVEIENEYLSLGYLQYLLEK